MTMNTYFCLIKSLSALVTGNFMKVTSPMYFLTVVWPMWFRLLVQIRARASKYTAFGILSLSHLLTGKRDCINNLQPFYIMMFYITLVNFHHDVDIHC